MPHAEPVSLVTCCMNRREHLAEALPTWLGKGFAEILVVDWSSNEPFRDLVNQHQDGTLTLVELVDRQPHFHQARSKNLKMRLATTEVVCSLDCDVQLLADDFLDRHRLPPNSFIAGGSPGLGGSGFFRASDWRRHNGCCEAMTGWGYEDWDLYRRLRRSGLRWLPLDLSAVRHIPHDDADRTRCLPDPHLPIQATHDANRGLSRRLPPWTQTLFPVRIHRPGQAPVETLA